MILFPIKAKVLQECADFGYQGYNHPPIPVGSIVYSWFPPTSPMKTTYGNPPMRFRSVQYKGCPYLVPEYMLLKLPMKGIAKEELEDENWKSQEALGYKNIPKGSDVEIIDPFFSNLYGNFVEIRYCGRSYYVRHNMVQITENVPGMWEG